VLSELNIPFAITGYTVRGALYRYLYKRFDENYIDVKTRLAGVIPRDGTYTQEHIPYAVRKLNELKKRMKILIVVTDSEELESPIRFKKAVEMAKDSDIELLGLGISTNTMQSYFDRFLVLENLNRLGEELLKLLRSALV